MGIRRCRVIVGPDPVDELTHAIDVEACSLYEAAVVGLEALQREQWTMLLTGESGAGKERLAQFIHGRSRRSHAPFVAINCGALTGTLLESELFGHKRGAFTGAHVDGPGLIETAHTGTLFLDEIGECLSTCRPRCFEYFKSERSVVSATNHSRRVDVRILTATNRNLAHDAQAHRFRPDLYYRVSVIVICIPPLRERTDDLDVLLRTLLTATALRLQRPIAGVHDSRDRSPSPLPLARQHPRATERD